MSFQANAADSDPRYSFHHNGESNVLRVFEAPIDMLSYITLHPAGWKLDSYVALCGVSEHALLWMLEQDKDLTKVILHLDNDPAGIEADFRLSEILRENGHLLIYIEKSENKDWNEDLKALNGVAPCPAVPHPKLALLPEITERLIDSCAGVSPRSVRFEDISADCNLLRTLTDRYGFVNPRRYDRENKLLDSMLTKTTLFISNELRQMESPRSLDEIVGFIAQLYAPHKDNDHIRSKISSINKDVIELGRLCLATGIRTKSHRDNIVSAAFQLAQDCLRTRIAFELPGSSVPSRQ